MESTSDHPGDKGIKRWAAAISTHILLPALVAFITGFFIQPWATQYWSMPRIKVLGVLPIRLIETQEGRIPFGLERLGLILKIHNPSPSAGIVIPVATTEGCVKIMSENTSSLEQAAEMSLPPDERVAFGGSPAAARRHRHTVQRIFISGNFHDSSTTNIGISTYGTEYVGVFFRFEPDTNLGIIGTISLDGTCSEIKERNTRPTSLHLFAIEKGRWVLRPEFSTGQLKISIHAGSEPMTVPPEVIKPVIADISWTHWTHMLFQQMYENPSTVNPPTR
jgi:hypothetical protein